MASFARTNLCHDFLHATACYTLRNSEENPGSLREPLGLDQQKHWRAARHVRRNSTTQEGERVSAMPHVEQRVR